MILAVIESFVINFTLLLVCVVNIRNGAVGGVHFYEQPVKDRVVELGLITENEIKRNKIVCSSRSISRMAERLLEIRMDGLSA